MKKVTNLPIPEKEYLTIEQRKVVNWYRKVLQVRNTPLLFVDLTDILSKLSQYKSLKKGTYSQYLTEHPKEVTTLSNLFHIEDVNKSALQLYGYTDKTSFLAKPSCSHIKNLEELVRMLAVSILENRQYIEIETTAYHSNNDPFKISIELIIPNNVTKVIVSIACLSDADQLSIKQFQNKNIYDTFVDQAPVCIHEIDQDGRLQTMNATGLTMMHVGDIDEIKGLYYIDLVGENDRERIDSLLQRAYEGYSSEFEFTLVINNSTRIFTSCFIPMEKKSEGKRRIIGVTQDITERKASEEELYLAANYDPLTTLRNRTNFLDSANQLIAQASRHQHHLALLFIDLDNFKPVNDTYGHEVGDLVLQEVSLRLKKVLRQEDIACRYGGDEFVVLLPYIERAKDAKDVAVRLMALLGEPLHMSGVDSSIRASIGISTFPEDGATCKILISHADDAMYQAKRAGGNMVRFFDGKEY